MAGVEDRVALVTGAGRGIGLVTAQLLAAHGAPDNDVKFTEMVLGKPVSTTRAAANIVARSK